MNRDALIVYLENIKDLEIAKYSIKKKYESLKSEYDFLDHKYSETVDISIYDNQIEESLEEIKNKTELLEKAEKKHIKKRISSITPHLISVLVVVIIFFIWAQLYTFGYIVHGIERFFDSIIYIVIIALPISFLGCFGISFLYNHSNKAKNEYKMEVLARESTINDLRQALDILKSHTSSLQQTRLSEIERTKDFPRLKEENKNNWDKISIYLKNEEAKVQNLLEECYSDLNIVPMIYLELASMIYIYDYISTSQVDFEFVLRSSDINTAVENIRKDLNSIILNQKEILLNTRQIARNTHMIAINTSNLANMVSYIAQQTEELNVNMSKIADNSSQIVESTEKLADNSSKIVDSTEKLVANNLHILNECKKNSKNSRLEAMYSAVIAHYVDSNAYFNAASYLRD